MSVLAILTATASAIAAGEFVIIAASSDAGQLQPGKIFKPEQKITLNAGERITLLSESGQVVKLKGPYSGLVSPRASAATDQKSGDWSATIDKISKLVTRDAAKSNVLGASRALGARKSGEDDLWLMAVDSSGHRCVRAKDVAMWRKKPRPAIKITLRSKKAKRSGLPWGKGEDTLMLPPEFIEDGTLIVMKIDKQPRRFNLHVLPDGISEKDWGPILHWMIKNQCSRQSYLLIDELHNGE